MAPGSVQATSSALPVSTKLQKKNAKKSEAKKAAKVAEEADRQRRLAMHKRDIEKWVYSCGHFHVTVLMTMQGAH